MNSNAPFVGWKIWYGDGSVFSSSMGRWEDAPNENVQCIIIYQEIDTPKTRLRLRGSDHYDFDGERFYKSNNVNDLPGISIKNGKLIDNETFAEIIKLAKETPWL